MIIFYLFICGLYNGNVSSSDCVITAVRMISEYLSVRDEDGNGHAIM